MTRAEYQQRARKTWAMRRHLARLRIWRGRYEASLVPARCKYGHAACSIKAGGPCLKETVIVIESLERELETKNTRGGTRR